MVIIMNNLKKYTIADILMDIHDMECVFLKTDTMEIVNPWDYLKKYLPDNPTEEDYEKLPSKVSLNIYPLPSYEFIDHKSIMSEFVKNIWDDKEKQVAKLLYQGYTQEEIGRILNYSQPQISRYIKRMKEKAKK